MQGGSSITRFGVEEQNHLPQSQQAFCSASDQHTEIHSAIKVADQGVDLQLDTVSEQGVARHASELTGDLSKNLLSATLAPSAAGSIR